MELQIFSFSQIQDTILLYGIGGDILKVEDMKYTAYEECEDDSCVLTHHYRKPLDYYRSDYLSFHKFIGKNKWELKRRIKSKQTYELNVDPMIQFYTICGISAWCKTDDVRQINGINTTKVQSLYGVERDSRLPKIQSFDIECNTNVENEFPTAIRDEIITIGNVMKVDGEITQRVAFILYDVGEYESKYGEFRVFTSEKEMLEAWIAFVQTQDPDVLIGHNVINFDLKYIIDRCKVLKINPNFGRRPSQQVTYQKEKRGSDQKGYLETLNIQCNGRLILDTLHAARERFPKFQSHSLEALSRHFFNDGKDDIAGNDIKHLFKTSNGRGKIADYCLKDCDLPLKLENAMQIWNQTIEKAKIVRLPPNYILSRGEQIRVLSLLYLHCNGTYVIPDRERTKGEKKNFKGAVVLPPVSGYYQDAVGVFDFSSLYPSIMITYNLCYTTLCRSLDTLDQNEYNVPPFQNQNDGVVKIGFRKNEEGILPRILKGLLTARKNTRELMKTTTDKHLYNALDAMQLGYKVTANSIYGFTGAASMGYAPCLEISSSVTAYGRYLINYSKEYLEKKNFQVLYGDTDSVMFKLLPNLSLEEAFTLAETVCNDLNKEFTGRIVLEFEKIYQPFLLGDKKKRYTGLKFTSLSEPGKIDIKGLQCVRGDSFNLLKEAFNVVIEGLLIHQSIPDTLSALSRLVQQVLNGERREIEFKICKKYNRRVEEYKVLNPHSVVIKALENDPLSITPSIGDTIGYIYSPMIGKKIALSHCARIVKDDELATPDTVNLTHYLTKVRDNCWPLFEVMHDDQIKHNFKEIFSVLEKKRKVVEKKPKAQKRKAVEKEKPSKMVKA